MKHAIRHFLCDESGSASFDSAVVVGGAAWMAVSLVADVSAATLDLTDDINHRMEYSTIVADILGAHGPGADLNGGDNDGDDLGGGDDGDGNSGHGNDDDGHDEDNTGRGGHDA